MPIEGREKGVRSPYSVVYGHSPVSFLGINRQRDAAAISDGEGLDAVNTRIIGGVPTSRPGQAKVNVIALAAIHGFHDSTGEDL